jgi:hypothetical protein
LSPISKEYLGQITITHPRRQPVFRADARVFDFKRGAVIGHFVYI